MKPSSSAKTVQNCSSVGSAIDTGSDNTDEEAPRARQPMPPWRRVVHILTHILGVAIRRMLTDFHFFGGGKNTFNTFLGIFLNLTPSHTPTISPSCRIYTSPSKTVLSFSSCFICT